MVNVWVGTISGMSKRIGSNLMVLVDGMKAKAPAARGRPPLLTTSTPDTMICSLGLKMVLSMAETVWRFITSASYRDLTGKVLHRLVNSQPKE